MQTEKTTENLLEIPKERFNHVEHIMLIMKSNLKLQCKSHVYMITVMYTHLQMEL